MIPVNIRMFDIESASKSDVERIKLSKRINRRDSNEMYILNNDEILATKITVNRQDVEYVIQELYKFETEFEVRTEDELNKKYGSGFKIFAQPIGKFNLGNKKLFKKTNNYILPKNLDISLFSDLVTLYCYCENKDEMLTVPVWLFENLIANYNRILRNKDLYSISIKHIDNAKLELITYLFSEFNVEILSSFSYVAAKETKEKVEKFSELGIIKNDYERLNRIIYNAEHYKETLEELGIGIKIEKAKQMKLKKA